MVYHLAWNGGAFCYFTNKSLLLFQSPRTGFLCLWETWVMEGRPLLQYPQGSFWWPWERSEGRTCRWGQDLGHLYPLYLGSATPPPASQDRMEEGAQGPSRSSSSFWWNPCSLWVRLSQRPPPPPVDVCLDLVLFNHLVREEVSLVSSRAEAGTLGLWFLFPDFQACSAPEERCQAEPEVGFRKEHSKHI